MPPYVTNPVENATIPSTGQTIEIYNPPQSLAEGGVGYSFGTFDALAQVETGEVPAAGAGLAFAITSRKPVGGDSGRTVTYDYSFGVGPNAITVALQGAMRNVDADYQTIDSNDGIAATSNRKTVTNVRANFLRLKVTALTIGNGTLLVGRILA